MINDYPRDSTIVELVSQQARHAPDIIAVESSQKTLTYAELDEESGRLAGYLRGNGVRNGDFVAVAVERNCNQVVALLATLKAGAAYVPMDTGNPPARSSFILEDADVKLAITDESSRNAIPDFDGRVLFIDSGYPAGTDTYSSQSSGPLDAAYLNYTSGSTGTPKGVVIPHRAVTRLVCNTDYLQLATGDRVLQGANIAFDAATFEVWGALINGATIVTVPRETTLNPEAYSDFVQSRHISAAFVTTALFNQIARTRPAAFSGMRAVLFGGEAVDPHRVGHVRVCLRFHRVTLSVCGRRRREPREAGAQVSPRSRLRRHPDPDHRDAALEARAPRAAKARLVGSAGGEQRRLRGLPHGSRARPLRR